MNEKRRDGVFRLSKRVIFMMAVFAIILEPRGFQELPTADNVYNILKLSVGIATVFYCIFIRNFRLTKWWLLLFSYRFFLLISTWQTYGSFTKEWTIMTCDLLLVVLLIEIFIKNCSYAKTMKALYLILIIYHAVNLYLCIFPEKSIFDTAINKKIFLLGGRTNIQYSGIPMIAISLIVSYLEKKRVLSVYTFLALLLFGSEVLLQWTATSVFGFAVITAGILLVGSGRYFQYERKRLSLNILGIAALCFNYSIIVLRVQDYFKTFIVDILHRDLTFTHRIYMWDVGLYKLAQSPVWGYGEGRQGNILSESWMYNYTDFVHWGLQQGHSQLIQTLHDGGAVGFLLLIIILVVTGKTLNKYSDTRIKNALIVVIATTYFMMLTEILAYYVYYFMMLTAVYYLKNELDRRETGESAAYPE